MRLLYIMVRVHSDWAITTLNIYLDDAVSKLKQSLRLQMRAYRQMSSMVTSLLTRFSEKFVSV